MIEKERLEELIEQGATIWHIIGKNIFNLNASDVPTFYTLSDENWDVWKDDYYETEEFNYIDGDDSYTKKYKIIYTNRLLDYNLVRL